MHICHMPIAMLEESNTNTHKYMTKHAYWHQDRFDTQTHTQTGQTWHDILHVRNNHEWYYMHIGPQAGMQANNNADKHADIHADRHAYRAVMQTSKQTNNHATTIACVCVNAYMHCTHSHFCSIRVLNLYQPCILLMWGQDNVCSSQIWGQDHQQLLLV